MEEKANSVISAEAEVKCYGSSSDPERRVWESAGWSCPCGGTHVSDLSEIGKIRLKRKNIGSGKERIEILLVE